MKKIIISIFFSLVLLVLIAFSLKVMADDRSKHGDRHDNRDNNKVFNPDKQLSKSACGDRLGNPVLDVSQKVKNDVDSGFGTNALYPTDSTNYWNVEGYTRHIQVWSTGADAWCATVVYSDGQFNAFYKQTGPAGTGLIGAGVDGEMSGGYRATFTGTFAPGAYSTHGNIGLFDYNCDLHATCPGYVDLFSRYFSGYTSFDQPWWGWKYTAGSHGTWINASDVPSAVSGNIL